jgi:hypothetical protein
MADAFGPIMTRKIEELGGEVVGILPDGKAGRIIWIDSATGPP